MSPTQALWVCGLIVMAAFAIACPELSAAPPTPQESGPTAQAVKPEPATIKPLTKGQQEKLLKERLDGGMGNSFSSFSNMFLVMSRMKLSYGVGLMTGSRDIAKTELQPVFPKFYQPTLHEFLDAIALQTSSRWKYDSTGKYIQGDGGNGPVEGLAIFEFTATHREKPFEVTPAKGWKSTDKGNWMMYVPPMFPVGMDIYELGDYSSDDKTQEKELLAKVPIEVSLEWARRAKDKVDRKELKPAKVGPYDALYFETRMTLQGGMEIRWRQWVFMAGNRCYFVVSTILPELEDRLFPDVKAMVASFRIKKKDKKPAVNIVELPRPNSGTFSFKQAEARKSEILSNAPTPPLKEWKNPYLGFCIHINKDESITVYNRRLKGLNENKKSVEKTSVAEIKKMVKEMPLQGNPAGILITSDVPLKNSKVIREVLDALFVPSVQLFYAHQSEPNRTATGSQPVR
jgi:hypothetical protein